jgi:putative ABC transport system permease protein
MKLSDTITIARRAIMRNRSRSLLTMLGIIIGVGSVVLMTSIGASVQGLILGQVSSLGAKSMVIFPGREEGSGARGAGVDSITFDDLDALKRLTTVQTVAPIIIVNDAVTYGREETTPSIMGTTANYFRNQSITVQQGRVLDEADEQGAAFVAVIGPDTSKRLFGDQDPLGKRIIIMGQSFTIVGLQAPIGSQFFQNADTRVYIPFSVARILTGQSHLNFATMTAVGSTDLAAADIKSLLRQRHRIDNVEEDPNKDDFVVRSAEQAVGILSTVSVALTLFLSAIASIALVVGGIGIMNIMLVAVTERTREIGLRKAVGARRRDILMQFLVEAVMLTIIGGLIGVVGGIFFAFLIASLASGVPGFEDYLFAFSPLSVVMALVVSASVGLIFGIMPARRAASLRPIEALRYE